MAKVQVAHETESVVRRDDHDVPRACKPAPILVGGSSRTCRVAASVAVEHHRALASVCRRRPDVQEETVLGRRWFVRPILVRLHRRSAKLQGFSYTRPRLQRWSGFETIAARGGA